ncbi:MAG: manganese-binding transcriptional regulator MntR [Phycisphaerae bacterium]
MKSKRKVAKKAGGAKKTRSAKVDAAKRRRAMPDAAAARQAQRYSKTRRDHSAEIAEDYVELIAQLIRQRGEARTVDIAERLGVSHVTATKTISRLQREGLVRSEPYRSIFLTDQGRRIALQSEERHKLVVEFLRKLGVNPADAEIDAEGLEHHFGEATMAAIRRFVELGR